MLTLLCNTFCIIWECRQLHKLRKQSLTPRTSWLYSRVYLAIRKKNSLISVQLPTDMTIWKNLGAKPLSKLSKLITNFLYLSFLIKVTSNEISTLFTFLGFVKDSLFCKEHSETNFRKLAVVRSLVNTHSTHQNSGKKLEFLTKKMMCQAFWWQYDDDTVIIPGGWCMLTSVANIWLGAYFSLFLF